MSALIGAVAMAAGAEARRRALLERRYLERRCCSLSRSSVVGSASSSMLLNWEDIEAPPKLAVAGVRTQLLRRPSSPPRRVSSLAAEVTSEQRKAVERLADYPRRVERLKRLWAVICDPEGRPGPPERFVRSRSAERRVAGAYFVSATALRNGALTAQQIEDLMTRDLTPEDYELLLLLDEGIKKAKTMSPEAAAALPRAIGTEWVNEACSICLCALELDEDVRMLPACRHFFHAPCAERWLTSSKATCPVCGADEGRQEKVMAAFRRFDMNGDGGFVWEDMRRVLAATNGSASTGASDWLWNTDDINRVFDLIDVRKHGRVTVEDFVNWIFASDGCPERKILCAALDI